MWSSRARRPTELSSAASPPSQSDPSAKTASLCVVLLRGGRGGAGGGSAYGPARVLKQTVISSSSGVMPPLVSFVLFFV